MLLVFFSLWVGTLVLLAGGRASRMRKIELKYSWAILLSGVVMSVIPQLPHSVGLIALVPAALVLLIALVPNRGIPGIPLMLCGMLMNVVAILAYGAMPVAGAALQAAGDDDRVCFDNKHELMAVDDGLAAMIGDTLPVPAPVSVVVSGGDLLLLVGAAVLIISCTTRSQLE